MFKTLQLKDGDIQFNSFGELVLINNHDSIRQSIFKRLDTVRGNLFYNLDYGLGLELGRLKQLESNIAEIQYEIEQEILKDERIESATIYDLSRNGKDGFDLNMRILLTDGTTLDINYNFTM